MLNVFFILVFISINFSQLLPTYDQLNEFTSKIETTLNNGDGSFLAEHIALVPMIKRFFYNNRIDSNYITAFVQQENQLKSEFVKSFSKTSEFKNIDVYDFYVKSDTITLLLRSISEKDIFTTIDYYEFVVNFNGDKFTINDIYFYDTGYYLEESFGIFLSSLFLKMEPDYYRVHKQLDSLSNNGAYQKAKDLFISHPDSMKNSIMIYTGFINDAIENGDTLFVESILSEFELKFGKYWCVQMQKLNYALLTKNYKNALELYPKVYQFLGKDEALRNQEAAIHLKLGQKEKYEAILKELIDENSQFEIGYDQLIQFYINNKNYENAKAYLVMMKDSANLYYYEDSFAELEMFKGFNTSEIFKNWNRDKYNGYKTSSNSFNAFNYNDVLEKLVYNSNNGDGNYLIDLLNYDEIISRSTKNISINNDEFNAFIQGFSSRINTSFKNIFGDASTESNVKLMSIQTKSDTILANVRVFGGGAQYFQLYLKKEDTGYKIFDIYIYIYGQLLSESLWSVTKTFLLKNEDIFQKFNFQDGTTYEKELIALNQASKYLSSKKAREGYEFLTSYKSSIKQKKLYSIYRILLASEFDKLLMTKLLVDYEKKYPKDVSLRLLNIDRLFEAKKYTELRNNLDEILNIFSNDAGIYYFKAITYFQEKNFEQFAIVLNTLLKYEPDFVDAYYLLIQHYIDKKNYSKVIETMINFKKNTDYYYTETSLKTNSYYSDFIASKEYKDWDKTKYFNETN